MNGHGGLVILFFPMVSLRQAVDVTRNNRDGFHSLLEIQTVSASEKRVSQVKLEPARFGKSD
jgi:hypothetical protein